MREELAATDDPPAVSLRVLGAIPWLFALAAWLSFPAWTVDDAWILVRYAENLAETGVATWNPGAPPTEGYTGHLFLGLLALCSKAGLDPIAAGRAIGVLSFFLGAGLLQTSLKRVGVAAGPRSIATALFLLAPFQPVVAMGGLETSLFGACLLAVIRALAELAAGGQDRAMRRREALSWGALLLLALARPEGWLLAPAGAAGLIMLRRDQGATWRGLAKRSLLFVLPLAALHAARWATYGDLLPNTFYAKQSAGLVTEANLQLLGQFTLSLLLAPAAACLVAGRAPIDGARRRLRAALLPLLAAGGATVALHLGSHLAMSYGHRFFAPFYGLALVALALHAPASLRGWRRLAVAGVALAQAALWTREDYHARLVAADYATLHEVEEHARVAAWLAATLPPSTRLAAVSDAGQVPHRTRFPTLDYGGLCEPALVRGTPTVAQQVELFYAWNADVAVFSSRADGEVLGRPDRVQALVSDPRFARYELAGTFGSVVWPAYRTLVFAQGAALEGLEATPPPILPARPR